MLMCVTSHARVFQCTRSRRHLGFEVGPAGRNPLKLCACVWLVACVGRSAIGLAAGLALSLSLAALPAFLGPRLAMATAAVAAGLGGTLLLLITRSICRAVYSVVCSEWV